MSIFDKVVAAVTPPESEQARAEARAKAQSAATAGDWLSMVLNHHAQIEAAFEAVRSARDSASRTSAQKRLAIILTGHSNAEESVLYPALAAQADEKGHATMAYTQQAGAKVEMAELETLAPMSQEYIDKLDHIRGAVAHHVYEEEGTWFLEIKEKLSAETQAKLTQRYREEFERYVGSDSPAGWSESARRSVSGG
jgi:hemerythrin superfamily protein